MSPYDDDRYRWTRQARQHRDGGQKCIVVLGLLLILIVASITHGGSPEPIRPIRTTHLYIAVTVWSDGSIDTADPVQLDHRSARRLAARLADEDDAANDREARIRAEASVTPAPSKVGTSSIVDASASTGFEGGSVQCQGVAISTGAQCRRMTRSTSGFCNLHEYQE